MKHMPKEACSIGSVCRPESTVRDQAGERLFKLIVRAGFGEAWIEISAVCVWLKRVSRICECSKWQELLPCRKDCCVGFC